MSPVSCVLLVGAGFSGFLQRLAADLFGKIINTNGLSAFVPPSAYFTSHLFPNEFKGMFRSLKGLSNEIDFENVDEN
jgi:hypothetical protein